MVVALVPMTMQAQDDGDDFGIWASVGVQKKFDKRWTAGAEMEWRTRDNVSTSDRWSWGVYGSYKITPWLKASAGYDLLDKNNDKCTYYESGRVKKEARFWGIRHRFNVALTANVDLGRWNLSLRERWQYTYRPEKTADRTIWSDEDDAEAYGTEEHTYKGTGKNVLRSRLQVAYDIPDCSVEPYVSAELFNGWNLQKTRLSLGADWKITKHHIVGAAYRYQIVNDDDDDAVNRHILSFGYTYRF